MPFTQFTNLDYDQIKTEIKNHLASNTNFTDFDFEGSNFSVLIDTLAYNTYINSFNANLVANESFLDSATVRENVISLARNIGYVPRSRTGAKASVTFTVEIDDPKIGEPDQIPFITLNPGLVCIGTVNDTSFRFSVSEATTANLYTNNGKRYADFSVDIVQGTLINGAFLVNTSQDQRFILGNSNIDTSTIVVNVKPTNITGSGREYKKVDNILNLNKDSEIFLLQEVQDEKIELLFGDGFFGKKLETGDQIIVRYIITDGTEGNGARSFDFAGTFVDHNNVPIKPNTVVTVNTVVSASNGSENENLSSIKYLAPRLYSAQYRAVTPRDYEAIIQTIYPKTESVAVVGGEELTPPKFGQVQISIKPKNGTYVSDFDKQQIKNKLKSYAIAGINSEIVDLKILYVECDSTIYYNTAQTNNADDLKTRITDSLTTYSKTVDINKFGGRFKYSKILQLIDRVDTAITSNITTLKIRRDLKVLINQFAQYELCFGNRFHINPLGFNIKSTGFTVSGSNDVVYLTDVPNKKEDGTLDGSGKGILSVISRNQKDELNVIAKSAGTVDYMKGEIILNTLNITGTSANNDLIEIQAFPESNDVVGLKDLYLVFSVADSRINMVKDVIASGEDVSGVVFTRDYYTSSYANGDLERK